jgi:hypothetical protein
MSDGTPKTTRSAATSPGIIEPQALYTVEEAQRRLRISDWAWRRWRREGLLVLRVSGRAFVSGRTLIQFIEEKGV